MRRLPQEEKDDGEDDYDDKEKVIQIKASLQKCKKKKEHFKETMTEKDEENQKLLRKVRKYENKTANTREENEKLLQKIEKNKLKKEV